MRAEGWAGRKRGRVVRNGEVPLSRNPRIPGPSDVEARVSYPLAAFATRKKRGRRDGRRPAPHTPPPPWTRSGGGLIVRTAPGIEKGQSPAKLGPRPSAMPAGLPSFREYFMPETGFP